MSTSRTSARKTSVWVAPSLVVRFNESYPSDRESDKIAFDENNRAQSEVFADFDSGGESVAGEHGWISEGAA
jgi:hypothetical protein